MTVETHSNTKSICFSRIKKQMLLKVMSSMCLSSNRFYASTNQNLMCNSAYRITCHSFTHVGIFCVSYSRRMVSFVWVPQLQLNHCKFQPNLHNVLSYLISATNLNYPSPGNWIIHPLIHSWYWVVVHPAQVINFCLNNQIR